MKSETAFQSELKGEIQRRFPGCVILYPDAQRTQGLPDLLILHNDKWAALECKRSASARKRPNQSYYQEMFNRMSFCRFIFPENKEAVLYDLQRAFESDG